MLHPPEFCWPAFVTAPAYPGAQILQSVASLLPVPNVYEFPGHTVHASVSAVPTVLYVPAGQEVQTLFTRYCPPLLEVVHRAASTCPIPIPSKSTIRRKDKSLRMSL